MLRLALVASVTLLAGCAGGATSPMDFFPAELPSGWSYATGPQEVPVDEELANDFEATPGRMFVAGLSDGQHSGLIQVLWFDAQAAPAAAAGLASQFGCDDDDLYHMLHEGRALVLVGVQPAPDSDEPEPLAAAGMDAVAKRIRADTGARLLC